MALHTHGERLQFQIFTDTLTDGCRWTSPDLQRSDDSTHTYWSIELRNDPNATLLRILDQMLDIILRINMLSVISTLKKKKQVY